MATIWGSIEDAAAKGHRVLANDAARRVTNVEAKEKAPRSIFACRWRAAAVEAGFGKRADQAANIRVSLTADLSHAGFESLLPPQRQVSAERAAVNAVWRKGQRR